MCNLKGCYVALVTPFDREGNVNFKKIEELVEMHLKWGTSGIVPVGTTGESPTLTNQEKLEVIKCVVKSAKRRIPVIAGTGSNCTKSAVENTEMAREAGADGALVVVPYYNRPSQDGIKAHFMALDRIQIPIIAYNLPGRTGANMLPETLNEIIKECKNVVGIKESCGSLDQITQISCTVPDEFAILSGDDSLTLPILSVGGRGVISVAANFIPHVIQDMINKYFEGKINEARDIHKKIFALNQALLGLDSNPIPIKTAMNILGYNVGETRLPLTKMDSKKEEILRSLTFDSNIISPIC